jgi:ATP-dependent DNA helicase RecG
MRPSLLDPLFAPLDSLPGVGPKLLPLLERLLDRPRGEARVVDLLLHLPTGGIDRRLRPKIADAPYGTTVTLEVSVEEHRPPRSRLGNPPHKVLVSDATGDLELVFFNHRPGQYDRLLPAGETRWISGEIELFDGIRQMVHPSRILDERQMAGLPPVEPVYPLTEGIGPRVIAKLASTALDRLPVLPEWQDAALLAQRRWPGFREALAALHRPADMEQLAPDSALRARLAMDEALASQLALALVRRRLRQAAGRATIGNGRLASAIRAALPFSLTEAQERSLAEITADMARPVRMLRLLQGDVGSGKTVVGLLAMATAVEAGRQAAFMAPTEVLARQHFARMEPLAAASGLRIALLTGRDKGAERRRVLAGLAAGEIDIAVGTHALFQEEVVFANLGLAVVDEQHRFGVHQRLALSAKGEGVDLLVMTATPIPRTLVLTWFGDMDVSVLGEKPAGRRPIETRAIPLERLGEVIGAIGRAVAAGRQVYWVCPLVAESEEVEAANAEERFAVLRQALGDRVGLVHGQLSGPDKDAALADFSAGRTSVLVATTVIEVGVDVPNATIMVIEQAERFGLAQLHQLRGRVGRGDQASSCLLLYQSPLTETARARLDILRQTEDGFRIAEEDLRLRGEGDVLGRRQSGMPGFRLIDMGVHAGLMDVARDDAKLAVERDADLVGPRGDPLRILLYMFGRDEAVRLLRAG